MKLKPLASGIASVALVALSACAAEQEPTEAFSAHQYKYVPTANDSNASTSSPVVGKSRMEARTREESVAVFRRPEPPPRPPGDVGHPRPPKPSK